MEYYQCLLEKRLYLNNYTFLTTWLPEKYAVLDKILKLKENGVWNTDWKVNKIYGCKDESFVLKHERDWAKQRKASDI